MPRPTLAPARSALAALAAPVALVALFVAAACHSNGAAAPAPARLGSPAPDTAAIRRDVFYLASDALAGRGTGTPGNDSAATYVARRYAALGLAPCAGDRAATPASRPFTPGCASYFQPFGVRERGDTSRLAEVAARNVVALVRGRDPRLRDEYVVVGAHYDHLGRSGLRSLDPWLGDTAIRNGADDNASGTAALLDLARLVARRPTRRTVVFAAFGAEELGVLGARHFVEHPPVPLDRVRAMLDLDMVGRLRDDRVIVHGAAPGMAALLDTVGATLGLRVESDADASGVSDHAPFHARGVPALHFTTGLHDDYHRATDDAEKIDVAGEGRIVALAERVLRALADRETPVAVKVSMK
ncbi:MAG TPA: M28 family peptidase [Gemmatimonadaceae bacterium]|nr:M28 family peptidase [Gemmatimonadaceae bacterium]